MADQVNRQGVGIFSIRNRLLIAVATAVIIPVLIVGYFALVNEQTSLEADLANDLGLISAAEAETIQVEMGAQMDLLFNLGDIDALEEFVAQANTRYEEGITRSQAQIELLASDELWRANPQAGNELVDGVLQASLSETLLEFVENQPGHTEVFITDAFGAVVASSSITEDYYQADEEWWQAAWNDGQGSFYIADSFEFDESVGQDTLVIALRIESDGEVLGVLRSNFTAAALENILTGAVTGETGRALLLDTNGEILVTSDDSPRGDVLAEALPFLGENTLDNPSQQINYIDDQNGVPSVMGNAVVSTDGRWSVVDALDWHIAFVQSQQEAFAPFQEILRTSVLGGVAVLVVTLVAAYLFAGAITAPLTRLTEAAQDIGQNRNFDRRVEIGGRSEFSILADAFNQMASEVQNSVTMLEQRVENRTRDLQTVTEVTLQTATILEVDRLLQDVVDLTKERFGLYHAHIYLLNELGDELELRVGAGHVGRQMVAEGRQIDMNNQKSIVAQAANNRRGQIVNDVTKSPNFLPHPLLPDTASELAVPLIARGQLLGVLDVQSEQAGYFTPEVLSVMELMATQIANALSNARLFEVADKTSRHENAMGKINREIQRATDIDEILQVAVRELGKALRVPHTAIELQLAEAQKQHETSETASVPHLTEEITSG